MISVSSQSAHSYGYTSRLSFWLALLDLVCRWWHVFTAGR